MKQTPLITTGGGLWGARRLEFRSLPSTNAWALCHAAECGHGDVVWARRQTGGHGRLGRPWASPHDRGLAVSVCLHSARFNGVAANVSQAAALAVAGVVEAAGISAGVKWPNDVMIGGRKIAGVLAEQSPEGRALVLGIGLNVNLSRTDLAGAGIEAIATSLRICAGHPFRVAAVLESLLNAVQERLERLERQGLSPILRDWVRFDTLRGQMVEVQTADGRAHGHYAGLDDAGRLRLRETSGQRRCFWSGDVRRVRADRTACDRPDPEAEG